MDGVNHRLALEELMDGVSFFVENNAIEKEEGAQEGILAAQYPRDDRGGETRIGDHHHA